MSGPGNVIPVEVEAERERPTGATGRHSRSSPNTPPRIRHTFVGVSLGGTLYDLTINLNIYTIIISVVFDANINYHTPP